MKTHDFKIAPQYFIDVCNLRKRFEIRRNDRNFQIGDLLKLKEFTNSGYTGRAIIVRVTYILKDYNGLEPNYIIMGIERIKAID